METWLLWSLVGFHLLGIIGSASIIGKPRQPMSYGLWVTSTIISVAIIVMLFVWGNPQ